MVEPEASPVFECDLRSWSELISDLRELDGALEQAVHNFGGDVDRSLSATTRKRLSTKSLQGLIHWRGRLHHVVSKLETLHNASRNWQETVKSAQDCQQSAESQLGEVMAEVQSAMDSLRVERAEKTTIQRELDTVMKKAHGFEEENRKLIASLRQTEGELETQRFASDEAVASMEEIQREKEALKYAADHAKKQAEQASSLIKSLQEEADKAKKLAERQQQVVAKLTADNLVFMMKLKETEGKLEEVAAERDLHKLAVEKKKGPWFNQVRESVEARMKDALSEAQGLESQMERLRQMHKQQLGEVSKEKLTLRRAVESAENRIDELEKLGRMAESSKARAEQERDLALKACETDEKKVQLLETEVRVLNESMHAIREESSKIWMKEQQLNSRIATLESDLEEERNRKAELEQEKVYLSSQLEMQNSVNQEVMRRKELVEWELMELRASKADLQAIRNGVQSRFHNRPIAPVFNNISETDTKPSTGGPRNQRHQPDEAKPPDNNEGLILQKLSERPPFACHSSECFPENGNSVRAMSAPGKRAAEKEVLPDCSNSDQIGPHTTLNVGSRPLSSPSEDLARACAPFGDGNAVVISVDSVGEAGNAPPDKQDTSPKAHTVTAMVVGGLVDSGTLTGDDKVGMDVEENEFLRCDVACGVADTGVDKDSGSQGDVGVEAMPMIWKNTPGSEVNRKPRFTSQPVTKKTLLEGEISCDRAGESLVEGGSDLSPENSPASVGSSDSGSHHRAVRMSLPSTPSPASCVVEVDACLGEDVDKENFGMNPWDEFEGFRGSGGGRRHASSIIKTEPSSKVMSP